MHQMVFNFQMNLLGWGPSLSLFIWDEAFLENWYEIHWRYADILLGRAEVTVQWL